MVAVARQVAVGVKPIGLREFAGVVVDCPDVSLHPAVRGDVPPFVVIGDGVGVRLPPDYRDGAPAKDFFDEGVDVR